MGIQLLPPDPFQLRNPDSDFNMNQHGEHNEYLIICPLESNSFNVSGSFL